MTQQLPSSATTLIVEAHFPHASAQEVFDYWTQPALLQTWWPQEAEIEPQDGGKYHLSWPAMNWHLRGRYTCFEPGKRLAFTWRWDHDEEGTRDRIVSLLFEAEHGNGTRLQLTHGPYVETPEDQNVRLVHHLAGWLHFLPRLQNCISAHYTEH